jgi:glycosyltransferase involved in cell wall biosynthesis
LQTTHPDIHLLLIGKGEDRIDYEAQAKGLDNITFEGFVDNVGDYLHAIKLFVFPSLNEGLGSILLDVMEHGVAIVASNVGGIPDIITHNQNGLLVAPKDSDALYQAIITLHEEPHLRAQLAQEALKKSSDFSAEAMCERYLKIYKEML